MATTQPVTLHQLSRSQLSTPSQLSLLHWSRPTPLHWSRPTPLHWPPTDTHTLMDSTTESSRGRLRLSQRLTHNTSTTPTTAMVAPAIHHTACFSPSTTHTLPTPHTTTTKWWIFQT